ncbi:MAG TPA: hypothetical protein VFB22_16490 [Candidatus Baltobacteraceae bacterium]|nr:hypothetical protein [Candidatus Baltobacteraceae bacterium]
MRRFPSSQIVTVPARIRRRLAAPLALLAACACAILAAAPAGADTAVPGNAILARSAGDALVIWDASPVVASIVHSKMSDADANALLEHDAADVLSKMWPNVEKSAKTLTVRIVYSKTGAVSPVYGTPTFMGIERYATLTAKSTDVKAHGAAWPANDPKTPLPAWLEYKIVGLLPPRA